MNESTTPTMSLFVSMDEAKAATGLSDPTLRRMEQDGRIPKRVNLGVVRGGKSGRPSKTGWPREVFYAALKSLAKESAASMQP